MQQGNQFGNNYDYDPYEQPPSRGLTEKIFGARIAQRLRSPAVAAVTLIIAGAAFAGIIAGTYEPQGQDSVPVIRAQADRFKIEPSERGGMAVPHSQSTVFNTVRGKPMSGSAPVENLLAANQEEAPADRMQAFERIAADEMREEQASAVKEAKGATPPDEAALEPSAGGDNVISGEPKAEKSETIAAVKEVTPAEDEPATITMRQEVEKIPPQELAKAESITAARPAKLHTPGASPETIEFVRDVLEKKDGKEAVSDLAADNILQPVAPAVTEKQAAAIAPAAGDATSFRIDPSGSYFVQVASVPTREATAAEWSKLQKKFSSLAGLEYRVSQADVAGRGTFYRIQAGPFSKEQASALCNTIKAQKPDGCLVVR